MEMICINHHLAGMHDALERRHQRIETRLLDVETTLSEC
jgi:hypothetical protein